MYQLNKTVLTAFLILSITCSFAQTASQKTVDETCSCVKKLNPATAEEKRSEQAFACMISSLQKYMPQLKKEYDIKIDDEQKAAEAVGRNVGGKIAKECP